MKIFITLAVLFALQLSGCSAYLAATQPDKKDLSVLKEGTDRAVVHYSLGKPTNSQKQSVDNFEFVDGYSTSNKVARVAGHVIGNTMAAPLWELVGIPFEALLNGKDIHVEVKYDKNNKVLKTVYLPLKNTTKSTRISTGVGLQYSLIGVRYDIYRDYVNVYISGGAGFSGGLEVPIKKYSVGLNLGGAPFLLHGSAHINYHFNGYKGKGLLVGIETGEYAYGAGGGRGNITTATLAYKL